MVDGEKQEKLRRKEQQRMNSVFGFLGVLCLVFVVAIVKLKHSPYSSPPRALRHKIEAFGQAHHQPLQSTALPPHSIYRLETQDGRGLTHKLDQYSGLVSLVVNVASK